MAAILVLALIHASSLGLVRGEYGAGQLKLADLLPENARNYDKMRPPRKDGQPTKVQFHVTVMGIDSINENSMTYTADIFFAQTWTDQRLRLPENMTSEYRLLEVEWLNEMWRPDSYFKNAKQVTFQTMTIPNHYVWLYKSKMILYMVKLTLTLSCAMNYAIYPHDTQECKLQIESLSHTVEDLIFDWEQENVALDVDKNIQLPQFDLTAYTTADCTQLYSTGNFTCLEVVFTLKRRLGYYLFHTYMPTCLIVIMSWISFWIKPEAAPARVTLGVTSLLTLSTQHAKSQAALPPVSYIKIIDMFMNTCTIFVFLALMEYAFVNFVLGDGPDGPPASKTPATDSDPTKSKRSSIVGSTDSSSHDGNSGEFEVPLRHRLSENGRLACLAKQLRLAHSSSPVLTYSTTRVSPKIGEVNEGSSEDPELPTGSFAEEVVGPHPSPVSSRITYKCGHQVSDATQSRLKTGNLLERGQRQSREGSSISQPHLPDCEALYIQTPHHGRGVRTPHAHQHNRSLSVGPYIRHSTRQKNGDFDETTIRKSSLNADFFRPNRDQRFEMNRDTDDGPGSYLNVDLRMSSRRESVASRKGSGEFNVPPPPPPPQKTHPTSQALTGAAKRRATAITIDRFSRIAFPLSFFLVNFIYWISMWSHI
ncbi:Neurotransmitter-gated ion-channel [Trinorchestia longiramus]|nr:Neurotransmitter-gated ion-channel [Trinorchestia longiramus]